MSEDRSNTNIEVDTGFLRSRRGILKLSEMVTLLVAFACFAAASRPKYIAATALDFVITFLLLLLYTLKLNKRFTFFFWPLIDVFNSVFAAAFLIVLNLIAVTTYTVKGTLVGGIVGLLSAGLLCVDGYMLFKNITFNRSKNEIKNQADE